MAEPPTIKARAMQSLLQQGIQLSNLGDFDGADRPLRAAYAMAPAALEPVRCLAMNLVRQGRWQEAVELHERALVHRPDVPELHRGLAFAMLATGDYVRGWREYEWRLRCQPYPGCRVNLPRWDGGPFPGRTILLHFEQGHGDTLQFIRFAAPVRARGSGVVVLCRGPLAGLIGRCDGVDLAFDGSSGYEPECHIEAPLMSLPAILGTTLETIPARVPYLVPDPAQVARWRPTIEPLRSPGTRLVGIAWQGDPSHRSDRWRSFRLSQFAPVAAVPGVRLISLQVGAGREQLASPGDRPPVIELPGRSGLDFDETAAIVAQLDMVIAPDSALTHLAGGLGVPVWVPLSAAADWRWLAGREDSPWYPTARLFRQSRPDDWDGVFHRIADALR